MEKSGPSEPTATLARGVDDVDPQVQSRRKSAAGRECGRSPSRAGRLQSEMHSLDTSISPYDNLEVP